MNAMKRMGLFALALGLLAMLAAPSAAGPSSPTYTMVATYVEPDAYGTVKELDKRGTTTVTVSCGGLTPGQEYCVVFLVLRVTRYEGWEWWEEVESPQNVVADKRGRIRVEASFGSWVSPIGGGGYTSFERVWVQNAEGLVVLN